MVVALSVQLLLSRQTRRFVTDWTTTVMVKSMKTGRHLVVCALLELGNVRPWVCKSVLMTVTARFVTQSPARKKMKSATDWITTVMAM